MRAFIVCLALLAAAGPVFAEDLEALARAIDQTPEEPQAYEAFAKEALKAKRYDDVIRKVKVGVARIPTYAQGYYWLALAYRAKTEWADAVDYYRRYIALNPNRTDPYFGLAASLEGLGDKKAAIAAYDKYVAIEKAPEKQRFIDLAKAELIKLDPSRAPPPPPPPPPPAPVAQETVAPPAPARADAGPLRVQAEQLQRDGKLDEAVTAYQRAIDADRGNLELYNNLGNVYFALKRYPEAARAFRETTVRDPSYAQGFYNLAHAYRKGDQKRDAVLAYRQYMKLRPDDPDPYYGLGQTLKALGDVAGAIDAFRHYVKMEKRQDEQPWVDKARAELQALEALEQSRAAPSGRIEEKAAGDAITDRASERLRRELDSGGERALRDEDDLLNPFDQSYPRLRTLRNPFEEVEDPFKPSSPQSLLQKQLREYGAAIETYRRALSRHVEDVSQGYERGIGYVLVNDRVSALRAWNSVRMFDTRVDAARRSVERVRGLVASRK